MLHCRCKWVWQYWGHLTHVWVLWLVYDFWVIVDILREQYVQGISPFFQPKENTWNLSTPMSDQVKNKDSCIVLFHCKMLTSSYLNAYLVSFPLGTNGDSFNQRFISQWLFHCPWTLTFPSEPYRLWRDFLQITKQVHYKYLLNTLTTIT